MALRYDLIVNQGEDYERAIPVLDGNGSPANVDGWGVEGQIREGYQSGVVLADLDVTASGTDVILRISASTSAAWAWRLARYDVELTAPNTTVTRFLQGSVVVNPEITTV